MSAAKPVPGLKELLSSAQLPALPQSAIRLLELSQNPDNGPAEFAQPIESDPGLTGQVLKFVNSSYFGFSREISSVKLAITLVGIRTIKNFSLWSAVFSLMPNPNGKAIWMSREKYLGSEVKRNSSRLRSAIEAPKLAITMTMALPRSRSLANRIRSSASARTPVSKAAITPARITGQPKDRLPSVPDPPMSAPIPAVSAKVK